MVYIIGTGPGDEDLLTIGAIRALRRCTAVLYDRLCASNVLNYLPKGCKIYYCGKTPGAHSMSQEEINELLVELAEEGHIVGRIKGGDPFIFGRGGEEILALEEANIPFEVIPGITSFISVLSYAGIPVTHRKIAQDFHVVTGKSQDESNVNYSALARENGTLIFMMGLNKLSEIVSSLIEQGKPRDTLVAVVMRGTTSKQKKVIGNLENIEDKVKEAGLISPCIIVVGEVVKFQDKFNWYERKPLFGHNICITRSKKQSQNLKNKLKELGAQVTEINSIAIENTSCNMDKYINSLDKYSYIVFTSANAVEIFFDYLVDKEYDVRNISGKIIAIGKKTEACIRIRGIVPYKVANHFTSEGLLEELLDEVQRGDMILNPGSSISRDVIKEALEAKGAIVDKVGIYDTVCTELLDKNAFNDVDYVFFASPSAVRNMIQLVGLDNIRLKKVIAIGPTTAKELQKHGIQAYVCNEHSEEGFIEEIIKIINEEVQE